MFTFLDRREQVVLAAALLASSAISGQTPRPGTIHTADVDLATFSFGSPTAKTTPVIAVNGGPGLSHIYMLQNDVWPRLAQHRLIVFYDQRGTGASKLLNPAAPQTMDAQVADLEAVRASLHVDKVDLVGDSFGGLLAMAYAAAHPEYVHTLILSDSAAPYLAGMKRDLADVFPDVMQQTAQQASALADPAAKSALQLRAHFQMIFYSPELFERYIARAPADLGSTPATGAAVSKSIATLDLRPALPRFHFPTLVINGRFDLNVTPRVAWDIAHAIPGAELVYFEHSGHLPSYEEPDRYVSVVERFLSAHRGAGAPGLLHP